MQIIRYARSQVLQLVCTWCFFFKFYFYIQIFPSLCVCSGIAVLLVRVLFGALNGAREATGRRVEARGERRTNAAPVFNFGKRAQHKALAPA